MSMRHDMTLALFVTISRWQEDPGGEGGGGGRGNPQIVRSARGERRLWGASGRD